MGDETQHSRTGRQSTSARVEVELFGLAGHDPQLHRVDGAFAHLLGMTTAEATGRPLFELVHTADLAAVVDGLAALNNELSQISEVLMDSRFVHCDGSAVQLPWVVRADSGRLSGAARDSVEFHRLLAERLDRQAQLALTLGPARVAMWSLSVRSGLLAWEPAATEVLGTGVLPVPRDVAGLAAVVIPEDAPALVAGFDSLLLTGSAEIALRVEDGAGLRHLVLHGQVIDADRRGRPRHAAGTVVDVTADRAKQEQMVRLATGETLPGVPERPAFDRALLGEWRRCTRSLEPLSVVIVHLDDFQQFTDTFGVRAGHEALCGVAQQLRASLHRAGDVVARFRVDEFAVVLPCIDEPGAQAVGRRLAEAAHAVVVAQAPERVLEVSMGAATWGPASVVASAADLLAEADRALTDAIDGSRAAGD